MISAAPVLRELQEEVDTPGSYCPPSGDVAMIFPSGHVAMISLEGCAHQPD